MKNALLIIILYIFVSACQQNKELKTPLIEKASNLEKKSRDRRACI
jgi:outer membrane lipoprotein-sorting protein